MEIEHYLTYQHNVQKYFRRHADKYSGIVVPMSIAVSFPGGTYGFVRALCAKDRKKRYAVDPRTPLFQKAWDRSQVRKPHEKMAAALGEPFRNKGIAGTLEPSDFDGDALTEAVEQCLAYQKQFRARKEDARKLAKYKKLLGLSQLGELQEPQFLIPPYFQFQSASDPWFEVSARAVETAGQFADGIPVRPVIHMRNWDAVGDWGQLLERFGRAKCSEALLYPNNFKEHEASLADLRQYRSTVEQFAESGVRPFALFGGYFSILLSAFGLRGFANGVGYGEWRDSGYHRGGTAALRVYVPRLHRYLDVPAAQNILDGDAEYFAAGPDLLSECTDGNRPLSDLSQEECLDHLMESRNDEISLLVKRGLRAAREELQETLERLDAIGPLEREKYGDSLERWLSATE